MVVSLGGFAAQTMAFIALPFLLLEVWQASAAQTGWLMACWPLGTLVTAALASRWIGRYPNGWMGAAGMAALGSGLALLALAAGSPDLGTEVAWSLGLCGLGFGLFQSPNNHSIITSAPAGRAGAASGMLGTARLTGQTLGAVLVATLFTVWGERDATGLAATLLAASALALLSGAASALRVRHAPTPR
jgi:DHA2 family multidrug resistance protein-like MFS transporter